MPPKMITCSICGDEVLKSQTICIDDKCSPPKRACKIHDGVFDKASEIQNRQKQDKIAEEHKKELKEKENQERWQIPKETITSNEFGEKVCCICRNTGASQQEFYRNILVAMEMAKQKGMDFNFLAEIYKLGEIMPELRDIRYLFIFLLKKPSWRKVINLMPKQISKRIWSIIDLVDEIPVFVCNHCLKKHDLGTNTDIFPTEYELSEKELKMGMVLHTIMKPVIQAMAKVRMANDN